ncbi:hypothetical protein GJ700_00555 [Duganella sp. FT92W]|uniref:Uncharacterized protein n=1 Tax=Pseudoduganella rivuli TaxID=2666085 RepID=A0A7X2II39_9BURK|nr:hypothetical protein [Pseudoduganella rivuli]MRV70211.1 hypothetical protein [Pseudoduganella rivuli]
MMPAFPTYHTFKPMKTFVTVLLALMMLGGCDRDGRTDHSRADTKGGKQYLLDLGSLIARADQITVTEHSSEMDFFDTKTGEPLPSKELTYKRIVLTKSQQEQFKSAIASLNPKTQDEFTACIPVPHHRIDFFAHGKLLDTMEVCFECSHVSWTGSKATPPWSLYGGLANFILAIGLQPKQDWERLATAGRKAG